MSVIPRCPNYRLRLFLSVDLVGSTAYKGGVGGSIKDNNTSPEWVYHIRAFYRNCPRLLQDMFEKIASNERCKDGYKYTCPRLWKTVGDEILLCNRIHDLEHLSYSVAAFMSALEDYGEQLSKNVGHLDAKGSAWTAAFPAPNVTVASGGAADADVSNDVFDENFEHDADEMPNNFDFLGKEMDSGFRITKHASSDKLALSATLAYLLSQAK